MQKFPTEKHLCEFTGDLFGYKDLSKKILDEVLLEMELPNCFGFYGNWGSGKSTMIHYIKNHLEDKAYSKVFPVYFEPWQYEYSSQKDLVFALLECIKQKTNLKSEAWKKIKTDCLVVALGVAKLAGIEGTDDDFNKIETKIYKEHERWIDKTREFKKDFQNILKKVLEKEEKEKLIIFVDDLDRCLPENAVKLLEGVKNFLSMENVLYVFAIDRRVVSEMIEKKYGLHHGYGDEYLMKIIQYYYDLPKNDIEDLVKQVFTAYDINYEAGQLKYITEFLQEFANEPRIAKHFLHRFCMSLVLSEKAMELLNNDSEKVQLQYLFVASYLLTKYPKYFLSGDYRKLLKNLRNCVIQKKNRDQNLRNGDLEKARLMIEKLVDSDDIDMLESIMSKGVGDPDSKFISDAKLSIALRNLKKAF